MKDSQNEVRGMNEFERMKKQGKRLEKFIKLFILFVFIAILIGWAIQIVVGVYFVKNPESIGNWLGQLFNGFNQ